MFETIQRGALVVAHPDDEVLWAGGLLARYGERITVICCSIPRSDPIRAWKFFDVCDVLGAKARLIPFVEALPGDALQNLGALDLSVFDLIVTHNDVGEYGHAHHRTLHRFVKERWGDKAATFGHRPGGHGTKVLYLTADEQALKLRALQCYDHISPNDGGKPKWQALLDRYAIDLRVETFDPPGT